MLQLTRIDLTARLSHFIATKLNMKSPSSVTPLLTLFTTWKKSTDRTLIHNITIKNWLSFGAVVRPVVFTNDSELASECAYKGWEVHDIRKTASKNRPILKYMFIDAINKYNSSFYCYSNSDILFTDGIIATLRYLQKANLDLNKPLMIVGKRTNVQNVTDEEGSSQEKIKQMVRQRGALFRDDAEDYFITTSKFPWENIPEFVVGVLGYDNWLVHYTRQNDFQLVDATNTILAVHQSTDRGNYEGHEKPDSFYNKDMIKKTLGRQSRNYYERGMTFCAQNYTRYNANGTIILQTRKIEKYCM